MGHVTELKTIEDEIIDAVDFLIDNNRVIISDLKKEFESKINKGRALHKGFKLQMFEENLFSNIKNRIREMYTFEKRWYMSSETAMLIEVDPVIKYWTNKIIEEVLNE